MRAKGRGRVAGRGTRGSGGRGVRRAHCIARYRGRAFAACALLAVLQIFWDLIPTASTTLDPAFDGDHVSSALRNFVSVQSLLLRKTPSSGVPCWIAWSIGLITGKRLPRRSDRTTRTRPCSKIGEILAAKRSMAQLVTSLLTPA